MAILDIFKRKKPKKEKGPEEKLIKKEVRKPKKKTLDIAWQVLASPHISEKATAFSKENKYVFKVFPRANKTEIKKAIADLYGVEVVDVKVLNVPRRQRRLGRQIGWRKGYKKAIVKIKEGQKIDVLPR